jgi:hypothetical protein
MVERQDRTVGLQLGIVLNVRIVIDRRVPDPSLFERPVPVLVAFALELLGDPGVYLLPLAELLFERVS